MNIEARIPALLAGLTTATIVVTLIATTSAGHAADPPDCVAESALVYAADDPGASSPDEALRIFSKDQTDRAAVTAARAQASGKDRAGAAPDLTDWLDSRDSRAAVDALRGMQRVAETPAGVRFASGDGTAETGSGQVEVSKLPSGGWGVTNFAHVIDGEVCVELAKMRDAHTQERTRLAPATGPVQEP